MATNQAAWFHSKGGPFTVAEAPMPRPTGDEIIIRTHALALNPADVAVWRTTLFTTSWPATIGCDVAGIVTAVGDSATKFNVGDRVLAVANWSAAARGNKGSGQLYCAASEGLAARVPEGVGFTEGCVLPLAVCTAASCLFQTGNLGLGLPGVDGAAEGAGARILLVWGGSSSVGSCGIQMARAAGLEVATVCGRMLECSRNFEYCKNLGAAYVFDYTSSTVMEDIVDQLKGKTLAGVFAAVISGDAIAKSAEIAHRLDGNKHVATVLPPMASSQVPGGLSEDVTISFCWSTHIKDDAVGPAIFGWITEALAKGVLRCKPDPEVVGRGLGAVQQAMERMERGVSATKLVVEIP